MSDNSESEYLPSDTDRGHETSDHEPSDLDDTTIRVLYDDPADPPPNSVTPYILSDFVAEGATLMQERDSDSPPDLFTGVNDGMMRLAHWALTGVHPDTNTQASIVIPPYNPDEQVSLVRDFDSLIARSKHLEYVQSHIEIFRVPPVSMSLASDIFIKTRIATGYRRNHTTKSVPLYTIPNIPIAKIGTRVTIYLFFPRLWIKPSVVSLTNAQVDEVYASVIKPAAVKANSHIDAGLWPPTLDGERFRSISGRRAIFQSTIQLPGHCVTDFGVSVMLAASNLSYGEDAFFLVDVRGHKSLSRHMPRDVHQGLRDDDDQDGQGTLEEWIEHHSSIALQNFCSQLDMLGLYQNAYDDTETWIDVAIEVRADSGDMMTAWRTDKHRLLVEHIVGELGLDTDDPELMAALDSHMNPTKRRYIRDCISALTGISGFRYKPQGDATSALYIQAYTNEKSLFARPGSAEKTILVPTGALLAPLTQKDPSSWYSEMYNIYNSACHDEGYCNSARIEARVPISEAHQALRMLNPATMAQCITCIQPRDYWGWRQQRLISCNHIWTRMRRSGLPVEGDHQLGLFATLKFIMDTLNSSPMIPWISKSIGDYALVHDVFYGLESPRLDTIWYPAQPIVEDPPSLQPILAPHASTVGAEVDIQQRIAVVPYGAFFIRPFMDTLTPMFKETIWRQLDLKVFPTMFSMSKDDLQVKLAPLSNIRKRRLQHPTPLVRHQRPAKRINLSSRETEDRGERLLDANLIALTQPGRPELGHVSVIPREICKKVLSIFRSIPINLLFGIPVPRSKESHLRKSALDCHHSPEDALQMFRTAEVWTIFQRVIVRQNPTASEWIENMRSMMRGRRDIVHGESLIEKDGRWKHVACVEAWELIMKDHRLSNGQAELLEEALIDTMKKFRWFPVIGGDRPWMQRTRISDQECIFPKELRREISHGHRKMQAGLFVIIMLNPRYTISDNDWIRTHR
ncbi:uncharacterized protein EI90DRAFT_3157848 [Cantharellus anzutake]|uniref:uncharacterized protein n=1 Tax=Cantharellus anzutake TaxID=1750568 RepID=UPI0019059D5B|nr:uncharacterized protein EI90DRAFT_3078631 [Cantharellus anzutake]XP_038910726.1 uncharacterized protein EI90DRAFT_3157848 [Cantharellus anzutake]KAF8321881.1 hypothetical protein EI90DRAFT_3078631 [Cantharellus anzutake]KAF8321888.1 hypothetical protein EI90DRAFT_3157848 [Cantharellus anzutake]